MAPQIPETLVNATNPESVVFEAELEGSTELAAQTAQKADVFQRSQVNRKRGWHDYQLLVSGNLKIFDSLCTVPSGALHEEDSLNGWNTFTTNGTDNIVNFVNAPPSYGRFPNFKATDRVVQATDGAIIQVQPSWVQTVDFAFDHIKNSFEGKNSAYYGNDDYYFGGEWNPVVKAPSEKEVAALKSRTKRPVAMVLLNSKEGFYEHNNSRNFEDSLKVLRQACAKFMQDYGDANEVRLFEITDPNDKTELQKIVSFMVSDLQEGRGIQFTPPTVRPWDADADKKFETLNVVKGKKSTASNRGLWTRFTKFITGRA